MASAEILDYLDQTADRETRAELEQAVQLVTGEKTAIDCGCGAGSDIAFLRGKGFLVHAFDSEPEAISRCRKRFVKDDQVKLYHNSFRDFDYPQVSLINADSSLFFCPETDFKGVWQRICEALKSKGIFVGSFLGPEDTMAGPNFDRDVYWPNILALDEQAVKALFKSFEIVTFNEHRSSGETPSGEVHHWHIFSVVARKLC
jgi:SAM-dependent methyltransferase